MNKLTSLSILVILMLLIGCKQQVSETYELVKVEGFEQPDWGSMTPVSEDNDTARQMFDAMWEEMEALEKEMESWTTDALTPTQIRDVYSGIFTTAQIFYTYPNRSKDAQRILIDLLTTYREPMRLDSALFFQEWNKGKRIAFQGSRGVIDANADTIQPHVILMPPLPDDTIRFNYVYDKVYAKEPYTHVLAYEQNGTLIPIFINHDLTNHSPGNSPAVHDHSHFVAHNLGLALDDQRYIDFWGEINGVTDPDIEEFFNHKTTYLHCHEPNGRVIPGGGDCGLPLTASTEPRLTQPRQNINPVWGKYFNDPLITVIPVRPDNVLPSKPTKMKNVRIMGVTYLAEMTVDGTKTLWPVKPQYFAFDPELE